MATRSDNARLAFESLSVEGGLLAPAWLAKIAALHAPHQSEADYRIARGLSLRDEIARYWRVAQAHWTELEDGRRAAGDAAALATKFVCGLLSEAFGFNTLVSAEPVIIGERMYPIGHSARGGRVPIIVAPVGSGLDQPLTMFGEEGRRRTAFGLLQEVLDATDMVWGVATDGLELRIARDNASLTRPAWISADLGRIFSEGRYADFAALWLLLHESRFAVPEGRPITDCVLEAWREAGREQGTRALGTLRGAVKDAVIALGAGFVAHPDNGGLRGALERGELDRHALYDQLLGVIYRLIFLLTVEERGLLHPEGTDQQAQRNYEAGYGMRRLRERAARRSAHDRHVDLWEAQKVVFRGLATGEPRLGLPALGGLFNRARCAALDASKLDNRSLLFAVYKLSWLRDAAGLARVNWRDMGPEELGSVYEGLIQYEPRVSLASRTFDLADARGNARKETGSYYTPDDLVQVLLDSALEPVIKDTIAANPERPADALLSLAIVDPTCGSGHFLLAAARRLAAHVARLQSGGAATAADFRHALRQVVGRCIYGVDLNPMAIDLCRVALWMEAIDPGQPLTFLDAHIQCGNALLGTTPELMDGGIPDEAWTPLEGDDRKVASLLKKRNKQEAAAQPEFAWSAGAETEVGRLRRASADLDGSSDADLNGLFAKETEFARIRASADYRHQKLVADAWCAAFVWPKPSGGGPVVDAAPTTAVWRDLCAGKSRSETVKTVEELAAQYGFLHWHLAFPTVFERGGFDIVLGNPPWERVKLQEQEYFASRNEEIANAPNAAARKSLIAALPRTDPALAAAWHAASREAEGQSHFARASARYPICGKGDVNTYALFAEHDRAILRGSGRAGFIVPTGIATDDTTKDYFRSIVERRQLASLYSFENEARMFPVHNQFKFALVALDGSGKSAVMDLVFFARRSADLVDPARHFTLSNDDLVSLNPNTRTCPTFRSRRDAALNLAIYRRAGVLCAEGGPDPWGVGFMRMFDMANDSAIFRTQADLQREGWRAEGNRFVRGGSVFLPLFEAKLVHIYDHRFSTYAGATQANLNKGTLPRIDTAGHADPNLQAQPEYWVPAEAATARVSSSAGWLLGWRDVMRSVDERTFVASLIPYAGVGHKFPIIQFRELDAPKAALLYANCCSFIFDYTARQKVGGASVAFFIVRQLPVLPPSTYDDAARWLPTTSVRQWLLPRVTELTYTAWDHAPFARDVGWDGPPFRWDPARRLRIRSEIDAAFFHLYGLSRDDVAYILDTFPIVAKNDERAYGEFRTKRLILEAYDALAEAIRTGLPYETPLDPSPGPPTDVAGRFLAYSAVAANPPLHLHPPRPYR